MAKSWGNLPRISDSKWEEKVSWFDFEPGNCYHMIRLVGPVYCFARHWIWVDPWDENTKIFPVWCPGFDNDTDKFVTGRCVIHDDFGIHASLMYMTNAFVNEYDPKKKTYLGWSDTPLGLQLPKGITTEIMNIMDINEGMDMADPKKGKILKIKVDSKKTVAEGRYSVQQDEVMPLTKEQLEAELYNFDDLIEYKSQAEMKENLKALSYYYADGRPRDLDADWDEEGTGTKAAATDSSEDAPPPTPAKKKPAAPPPEPQGSTDEDAPPDEQPTKPEPVAPASAPAAAAATPAAAATTPATKKQISPDCPTSFGRYAGNPKICKNCPAREDCIEKTSEED